MSYEHFGEVLLHLRGNAPITFLKDRGRSAVQLSYTELGRLVASNAHHFRESGVRAGDRVMLCLATDVEHVITFLGLMAAGAVPVSVKPGGTARDGYVRYLERVATRIPIAFRYHDLPGPDVPPVCWTTAVRADGIPAIETQGSPTDAAFVQFSSGSTADPKAITISHANLLSNIAAIHQMDHRTESSAGFNFLPLNHDMGLVGGLLSNLLTCNPLTLVDAGEFVRSPLAYLEVFKRQAIEVTAMPNFALRLIAAWLHGRSGKRPAFFRSLRTIYCGAETISRPNIESFLNAAQPLGLDPGALLFCYGLAEATLFVSGHRFQGNRLDFVPSQSGRYVANVGTPVCGTTLSIAGDEQKAGELLVSGPGVSSDACDAQGILHTGDIGFLMDNSLFITGRHKELIVVNGCNLHVQDIEEAVCAQLRLKECIALPDKEGQFYLAIIKHANSDPAPEAIASVVASEFGCSPAGIIFCRPNEIQRTTSGKPMRHATLAALKDHRAQQASQPS